MTEPMRAKTKGRIMALLAKAEDPAVTEAEAEAYNKKAYELIAKYGVDQAKLRAEMGAKAAHDELTTKAIKLSGTYLKDQILMLNGISKALGTHLIQKGKDAVILFGYQSDIERVEMLFSSLWLQGSAKVAKTPAPFGETRVRFVKSFMSAFTHTVYQRLLEAEKRAQGTGTGYDLVVQDKGQMVQPFVQRWLRDQGLRSGRTSVKRSNSGKNSGEAAGRTADIGQTRVDGGRLQIGRG
jgi:hypothetical protein